VIIRGNDIHDNNNGIFAGTGGGDEMSRRLLVEGNHIYNNGSLTDYYHHNVYNEVNGVVYQFNRFGSPRAGNYGVLGANIKERSAGVVIRYNWIEDGAHLIDVVDAQEAASDTIAMDSFHETRIYGNVLVRTGTDKGSMIHYGGDSGIYSHYRKGTLHFYQNTLVVKNEGAVDWDSPAVFELSTNDEHLVSMNNIYNTTAAVGALAPICFLGERDGVVSGIASFDHDWVSPGWSAYNSIPGISLDVVAQVSGLGECIESTPPGFEDAGSGDFALTTEGNAVGAGADLSSVVPSEHAVVSQYVTHQAGEPRPVKSAPSVGAFEP
jgi:hypothetical protein